MSESQEQKKSSSEDLNQSETKFQKAMERIKERTRILEEIHGPTVSWSLAPKKKDQEKK